MRVARDALGGARGGVRMVYIVEGRLENHVVHGGCVSGGVSVERVKVAITNVLP